MRAFSWRISSACSAFLVLRFSLSQARKDCPPSEIKAGASVRTMSAAVISKSAGWQYGASGHIRVVTPAALSYRCAATSPDLGVLVVNGEFAHGVLLKKNGLEL